MIFQQIENLIHIPWVFQAALVAAGAARPVTEY